MAPLGIAFSGGPGPAEIVDCVGLAETLGYESAWVAEGHGGDQFAVLAAAAARTSIAGTRDDCRARIAEYRRCGLDLPILSPYARGPAARATFEAVIRACAP